jgi:CheY-like chemotaxis protein
LIQKGDIDQQELLSILSLMIHPEAKPISRNYSDSVDKKNDLPPTMEKRAAKSTVLVIEDNPDNLATIKAILKDKYCILEAMDGETGLKKIISEVPDMVLLDISLPKMDGYAIVREVRRNKAVRHIPVIAVTASAMKGDRNKIIASGFTEYISKPVEPEVLLKKIREFLEQ